MALLIPATYPEPLAVFRGPGDPAPEPLPIGKEVKPSNGKEFTLDELQHYVGGNIEISSFPDGRMMVINEIGKLVHLEVNIEATVIYRQAWKDQSTWAAADSVVGDVLLCNPGEIA